MRTELEALEQWLATDEPPNQVTRDEIVAQQKSFSDLVTGWFYNVSLSWHGCYRVTNGCSNGTSHNRDNTAKTSSRGMGRMYRTKLDALKCARHELARQFVVELRKIQSEIDNT